MELYKMELSIYVYINGFESVEVEVVVGKGGGGFALNLINFYKGLFAI